MIHELKCWAQYFDAIKRGEKNFEVRRDDRGFQRGDTVVLQRATKRMIGGYEVERDYNGKVEQVLTFQIGWILTGGQFGIEPGYVAFSLLPSEGERGA